MCKNLRLNLTYELTCEYGTILRGWVPNRGGISWNDPTAKLGNIIWISQAENDPKILAKQILNRYF